MQNVVWKATISVLQSAGYCYSPSVPNLYRRLRPSTAPAFKHWALVVPCRSHGLPSKGGGENKFVCVFLYSEKIRKTKFSFTQALVFRYAGFQYRLGKFLRMKTLNTMHTSSVRSELQRDNFREALTVCSSLLPSNPAPSLPFFSVLSSHINPIILFLCSNAIKMW